MKGFDYWMLGIIDESIRKFSIEYCDNHAGCSYNCLNRWCDIGKRNLILKRIDEIKEKITVEVLQG